MQQPKVGQVLGVGGAARPVSDELLVRRAGNQRKSQGLRSLEFLTAHDVTNGFGHRPPISARLVVVIIKAGFSMSKNVVLI